MTRGRTRRITPLPLFEMFKMNLKSLLKDVANARSTMRLVHMDRIREYVRVSKPTDLIKEIKDIHEPKELDILIGVGMKGILWSSVVSRRAYLEGVGV